jgi:hypothetical protein
VDPLSPVVEPNSVTISRSPSPLLLPPPPQNIISNQEESLAQEEMRQHFHWLTEILNKNQKRGWGTAYRDFVDVVMLLKAVNTLGMVELGSNRVSDGEFAASTGRQFILSLATFMDIMDLGQASTTWRNKLTMYFRIKTLYSYSQYAHGINFQDLTHQSTWRVVSLWMENRDTILAESWVTQKYGNTSLRKLLQEMVNVAHAGEYGFCHTFGNVSNTEFNHAER